MVDDGLDAGREVAVSAAYELKVWLDNHIVEGADREALCLAMLNVAISTLAHHVPCDALAGTLRQYADNVEREHIIGRA